MRFFITGTAGFIGFHLARRLLADGHQVFGYDALTPYYDVRLKQERCAILEGAPDFSARQADLADAAALAEAVETAAPDIIVHLAAQAGVRYSLEAPRAYLDANLIGTFNLLAAARMAKPRHLLIASSSSVYGANRVTPFAERHPTDHPLSLYAASKRATEALAHADAHLWKTPTTMLRFFTVYGPWGRPDMALFRFVEALLADRPLELYGNGDMRRDFTYIDDAVEAVVRLVDAVPVAGHPAGDCDSLSPVAPYRVVNVGGGRPVALADFVAAIERATGLSARRTLLPMQPGDVRETWADPTLLRALTATVPATAIADGVAAFVAWYRDHYQPARIA